MLSLFEECSFNKLFVFVKTLAFQNSSSNSPMIKYTKIKIIITETIP